MMKHHVVMLSDMKLIVFNTMKTKYTAILELGGDVYDAIMKVGKLKIGWSI